MARLNYKFRAATLVETLVAMVIILTCSGIGMALFANLSGSVNDRLKTEAELRMQELAAQTKLNADFTDTEVESDNILLTRSLTEFKRQSRIRVLYIEAYSHKGAKIGEYYELLLTEETPCKR